MASDSEVSEALKEVLPFLDVLTPDDYKGKIVEHVLGMTGTAEGIKCITNNKKLLDSLTDLVCHDKSDKIRLETLRILVNLSSTSSTVHKHLLGPDFLYFLLSAVIHKDLDCCDDVAMLLSNITQQPANCEQVAANLKSHDQVTIVKLVDAFCVQDYNSKKCSLHHLGSFLSNLTLLKDTRLLFLNDENIISRILPFSQYDASAVRRYAAASIIKNCLFETDFHEWLLSEVDILPHLLLPLAGPDELTEEENDELPVDLQYLPPDKQREPNKEIQNMLIESMFQLCATKPCRLVMKKSGTYYIMRELHKITDENDPIMVSLENLIYLLIGDEPEIENENLREVDIPVDVEKKFNSN